MSVHNIVYHLNALCVRYKQVYLFIIGLVVLLLVPFSAIAEKGVATNNYKNGWNAYQSGQYMESARLWQALSQQATNSSDNDEKLQAAFAAVLTTIAWEKAGNSQAYSSWSDAIRLYLEAGTQWEQQREQLKKRISDNRDALRHLNSDAPVVISPLDQLLLMVDDEVKLADYNGPRTGLQQTPAVESSEDVRGYFGNTTAETPPEVAKPSNETSVLPETPSELPVLPTVPVIDKLPTTVPVIDNNQEVEPILTTRHIIPIEEPEPPAVVETPPPAEAEPNAVVTPTASSNPVVEPPVQTITPLSSDVSKKIEKRAKSKARRHPSLK